MSCDLDREMLERWWCELNAWEVPHELKGKIVTKEAQRGAFAVIDELVGFPRDAWKAFMEARWKS
jgi:hypothetical protein